MSELTDKVRLRHNRVAGSVAYKNQPDGPWIWRCSTCGHQEHLGPLSEAVEVHRLEVVEDRARQDQLKLDLASASRAAARVFGSL